MSFYIPPSLSSLSFPRLLFLLLSLSLSLFFFLSLSPLSFDGEEDVKSSDGLQKREKGWKGREVKGANGNRGLPETVEPTYNVVVYCDDTWHITFEDLC
jgi:hypothetical protein